MRYGLPYKGSKNALAERLVSLLPPAETLIDLFAGGCSITHRALLTRKYRRVIANDLDPMPITLFRDAINGKYRNETEWISREKFFERKDTDPYVALCWSFSNNGRDYLYSREIEPWKRALHYARVFGDRSLLQEFGINYSDGSRRDIMENYGYYRRKYIEWYGANVTIGDINHAGELQSLERLQITNLSYDQVAIHADSVIYCDPPYKGTNKYNVGDFNHEAFYDWCCKQTVPVFISEYQMPADRFKCVAEFKHIMRVNKKGNKPITERLFAPINQPNNIPQQLKLF